MNTLRHRCVNSFLILLVALATAVATMAEVRPHQKIPAGKDCSSCHKKTYAEWKTNAHGKNDVQCTACHGDVVEKLTTLPTLAVCGQCHNEHALKPPKKA